MYKINTKPFYYFDAMHGLAENSVWEFQHFKDKWWAALYMQGLFYSEQKGYKTITERYSDC